MELEYLGIISALAIAIVSLTGVIITRRHNDTSRTINTFAFITSSMDTDVSRNYRDTLYHSSEDIGKLISQFQDRIEDNPYYKVHKAAWETCVIYDRIGFVIKQDKKLAREIDSYQSITIGKMYLLVHGLMFQWKKRGRSDHKYFQEYALFHSLKNKQKRLEIIESLRLANCKIYDEKGNTTDNIDELNEYIDKLILDFRPIL